LGSGPIVIGQAAEFDYAGTQACRALREEGIRTILVNSNPATIMTDEDVADAVYIEPLTPDVVRRVIQRERPDGLLPTLGGQTGLNLAVKVSELGILDRYDVRLLGTPLSAIKKAEDRALFKELLIELGEPVVESQIVTSVEQAREFAKEVPLPLVIRPAFTLGGTGGGVATTPRELDEIVTSGITASPIGQVLLERSLAGWKEIEYEVMRDAAGTCITICNMENLDPMGVHTGDSIVVAPSQTLSDYEYQMLRSSALRIIAALGIEGGCNIQYALNPHSFEYAVIEVNPRVSRSSALASKATGYPIAKIAAKVAVGYTLDEIANDITEVTAASFEPTLDYVVVKVPRFAFEKFPTADDTLTTHMKSVGEAMSIGRNFTEALNKALRSMENKAAPFDFASAVGNRAELLEQVKRPHDGRLQKVMQAIRAGATPEDVFDATKIDPWFVDQLFLIFEIATATADADELDAFVLRRAKRHGFSDLQIAELRGSTESEVRAARHATGVRPVYKTVDTCAAEFAAKTPYHYSTYDEETEVVPRDKPAVLILGSGPNRIGQGIEFDYSCVHAALELSKAGYETVMVNCNPETVSTDYDTADRLYFEPLTLEDVLEIYDAELAVGPVAGVIATLGGQTPLGLAQALKDNGVPIVGTQPEAIDLAEERGAFGRVLDEAGLVAPKHGTAVSFEDAREIAHGIGYPVLVRPSYVLGGRGMQIVYSDDQLETYLVAATELISEARPVLIDRFIDDAVEIDVDALYDGTELFLGGVMEHIEEAGIHSGDSSCALPPITFGASEIARFRAATEGIAKGVGVRGLINIQFALSSDVLYVLEANPRASRTVPFVSKATGTSLAKAASRVMLGESIADLKAAGVLPAVGDGGTLPAESPIAVKEAVLPFNRFRTPEGKFVDSVLGPEMKSTGEVMGFDADFGTAFSKSQAGAYGPLPTSGKVFVSIANRDKRMMIFPARVLADYGFEILATQGTVEVLRRNGIPSTVVRKHFEGEGPAGEKTTVQMILDGEIDLIVNTPNGSASDARVDGYEIRAAAVLTGTPCITTVQGAAAAVQGIAAIRSGEIGVRSLQEWAELIEQTREGVR
jgi:carbamoyl-phosphate synthase large subunit